MNMDYEIGQLVEWKTGNLICQGIVYEEFDDEIEIICRSIAGKECKTKLKVKKEILNKI